MTSANQTSFYTRRRLEMLHIPDRKSVKELNKRLKQWLTDNAGPRKAEALRSLRGKPERYQAYQSQEQGVLLEYAGHLSNQHYNAWIYSAKHYPEGEITIDISAMVQEFRPNSHNEQTYSASVIAISKCSWDDPEEEDLPPPLAELSEIIDQYRHQPRYLEPNGKPLDVTELIRDSCILAVPWQSDDAPSANAAQLAQQMAATMDVAIIDHAGHRAISRELASPEHILDWNDAEAAILTRYGNSDNAIHVVPVPVQDAQEAKAVIGRHDTKTQDHVAFQAAQEAIRGMITSAPSGDIILQELQEASQTHENTCHHEQRVYVLQDQLEEARATIAEREATIASLTQQRDAIAITQNDQEPEPEDQPEEPQQEENRVCNLLETIMDHTEELGHLTFMDSMIDSASDFQATADQTEDILNALQAIEKLGRALSHTPKRNVGAWKNFFTNLTGWQYRSRDSENTMGKYGKYRQFTHQGNIHTISRHLTCTSARSGIQIYFDTDEQYGNELTIAYIGPHLPYASQ